MIKICNKVFISIRCSLRIFYKEDSSPFMAKRCHCLPLSTITTYNHNPRPQPPVLPISPLIITTISHHLQSSPPTTITTTTTNNYRQSIDNHQPPLHIANYRHYSQPLPSTPQLLAATIIHYCQPAPPTQPTPSQSASTINTNSNNFV